MSAYLALFISQLAIVTGVVKYFAYEYQRKYMQLYFILFFIEGAIVGSLELLQLYRLG